MNINLDQNISTKLSWSQELVRDFFSKNQNQKISIQENGNISYLWLFQDSKAVFNFDIIWNDVNFDFFGIFFWDKWIFFDIKTKILSSNSKINIYLLSFLTTDKQYNISWDIVLWKNIKNSQWHLLEKNIILNKNIKIKVTPRLDVFSKDIQATHGFSIEKVDEENLFYLKSKWLDKEKSQTIILNWYLQNILSNFSKLSDEQKNEIVEKISSFI